MIALYSIKPIYSEQILNGSKIYELRKRIPINDLDYILIYASSPISKIVGYAEVRKIHKYSISETWKRFSKFSGIQKKDYLKYYDGCTHAYAIELGKVNKFLRPFDIDTLSPDCVPPQSFSYVNESDFKRVIKRKMEAV